MRILFVGVIIALDLVVVTASSAEQMFLRCEGYGSWFDSAKREPFVFTVIIDRERSSVVDMGMGSAHLKTDEFDETYISANQQLPRWSEVLHIDRVTGRFALYITRPGNFKHVEGTCAEVQRRF